MPSRTQFFAAEPAPTELGTICRICYEDMQSRHPIRLPCDPAHTFCKECITPWLLNQCKCMYMCDTPPWDPATWTDIDDKLIAKTAAQLSSTPQETFGVEQSKLEACRVMRWQTFLSKRVEPSGTGISVVMFNSERTEVQGTGWVIPQHLLLSTVSLANAIPLLVGNSPERVPYTASDMHDWRVIIKALIAVLPTLPSMVSNVEDIPHELRNLTKGKLTFTSGSVDVTAIPFLQPDHVCFGDFELLLEYLAVNVFMAPAPVSLLGIARTCEYMRQAPLLAKFALALML